MKRYPGPSGWAQCNHGVLSMWKKEGDQRYRCNVRKTQQAIAILENAGSCHKPRNAGKHKPGSWKRKEVDSSREPQRGTCPTDAFILVHSDI